MKQLGDALEGARDLPPAPEALTTSPEDSDCETCKGVRFVYLRVPVSDRRFGRAFPCPDCRRGPRWSTEPAFDIPPRFQNCTFKTFHEDWNPGMAKAVQACQDLLDGKRPFVFMVGDPGLGKTHLLVATVIEARQRGSYARMWEVPELLADLRSETFRRDIDGALERRISDEASANIILALDDLGAHNPTDWSTEQLFRILNRRYTHYGRTIITSNVPDVERDLDYRLRSRFREGLVPCEGRDIRGRP